MAKQSKDVSPDALLEKLRKYTEEIKSESERAERIDSYNKSDAPSSVEDLMKRLKEKGFLETLGSEDHNKRIKTEYSADEDGEFSEKNFFVTNSENEEKAPDTQTMLAETPSSQLPESVYSNAEDDSSKSENANRKTYENLFSAGKRYALKKILPIIVEETGESDDKGYSDEDQTDRENEGYNEIGEAEYNVGDILRF